MAKESKMGPREAALREMREKNFALRYERARKAAKAVLDHPPSMMALSPQLQSDVAAIANMAPLKTAKKAKKAAKESVPELREKVAKIKPKAKKAKAKKK